MVGHFHVLGANAKSHWHSRSTSLRAQSSSANFKTFRCLENIKCTDSLQKAKQQLRADIDVLLCAAQCAQSGACSAVARAPGNCQCCSPETGRQAEDIAGLSSKSARVKTRAGESHDLHW